MDLSVNDPPINKRVGPYKNYFANESRMVHGPLQMRYYKVGNAIWLRKGPILGYHAHCKFEGLNDLKFGTTEKMVFVGCCFSELYDILFWAHSASDCAKEVPQAPKKYHKVTCGAPGKLLWHSQRLTVPKQVCLFIYSNMKGVYKYIYIYMAASQIKG